LYRAAWRHSDESISRLEPGTPARVAWWPEDRRQASFGSLLVRVVTETAQHAGHCGIVRESIDGRPGQDHDDVGDDAWWTPAWLTFSMIAKVSQNNGSVL
jgi:hypothetical protein